MGGSSKGGGSESTPALQSAEVANTQALTALATQSQQQGEQLFNTTFPGLQTAENAAATLASGDPSAIARLIAPATQQITQATAGAKQNILNNAPSGGEKNLALESADVSQGAQVGSLASQGYNNSFNSLAQLAGQGVSQGQGATGLAISGLNASNQGLGNVVQQNIQEKGASLGAITGLGSTAASGLAYGLTAAFT